MMIMAREGDAPQKLRERLGPILAARGGRFYDIKLDDQGPVSSLESRSATSNRNGQGESAGNAEDDLDITFLT
jgi:hypothetical protein